MKIHNLDISPLKWFTLLSELKKRGKRKRESGAFLLGKLNSTKITDIAYYDDLDPNALDLGYIKFT